MVTPGELRVESERTEYGDCAQTLAVEYSGGPFSVGFNARYLADVLKGANGHKSVTVGFNSPLNPILCIFPDEPGYRAVVMPLRIEW